MVLVVARQEEAMAGRGAGAAPRRTYGWWMLCTRAGRARWVLVVVVVWFVAGGGRGEGSRGQNDC